MTSEISSMSAADDDWNQARRKLLYEEVVCLFKACSVDLLSFDDVSEGLDLDHKVDRGVQEIPLDRISGSVGRYDDFTSTFLPRKAHMRDRWERVDVAMKSGRTPPIEVYQVGESYFVVDGNHRVSVARQSGWETIKAHVIETMMAADPGPVEEIDELLIGRERERFLEKVGQVGPQGVRDIVFTCPHCYDDLIDMIETYRRGLEEAHGESVSFAQATAPWYEEVYHPAVQTIRENNQLARFQNRNEADLFIWSWRNHKALEELVVEEGGEAIG